MISEMPAKIYESVGPHFRHISDHYDEFFSALPEGEIDFDRRCRDSQLEQDRCKGEKQFAKLISQVSSLPTKTAAMDQVITIQTSTSATDPAERTRSSVARELQFLHAHTVHHLALIKLILNQAGWTVHGNLGVAPSTIKHQSAEGKRHAA